MHLLQWYLYHLTILNTSGSTSFWLVYHSVYTYMLYLIFCIICQMFSFIPTYVPQTSCLNHKFSDHIYKLNSFSFYVSNVHNLTIPFILIHITRLHHRRSILPPPLFSRLKMFDSVPCNRHFRHILGLKHFLYGTQCLYLNCTAYFIYILLNRDWTSLIKIAVFISKLIWWVC